MISPRLTSWSPIAGVLLVVSGGLGWLLLGFGGDVSGVERWAGSGQRGPTVEFFAESQPGTMTLPEVEQLPTEAWRHWTGSRAYVGHWGAPLWARVTVRNDEAVARAGVLADGNYFADRVEAWVGAGERVLLSGEKLGAAEKVIPGRDVAFPVSVPAGRERVVYLRATDHFQAPFQLEWWPEAEVYEVARRREMIAEAIYLGGLLALLSYNVLLWLRLRVTDIGYYVGYMGMVVTFMVLARGFELELGWALGSPVLEAALAGAMGLSGFFLTGFARAFLELKTRWPLGDRVAGGLAVVMLVVVASAVTTLWMKQEIGMTVATAGIGLAHVSLLVLALGAWRAGARQARFFVLSFGCFFAGSLPVVTGWLFNSKHEGISLKGLMIGSALEALLLSLAVADRFAQAQREKAVAQARLTEETEQRRVIEAAYADELEVEVGERTRDLEAANTDKDRMLIALGHDLRSPLAALTQRAEQLRGEKAGVEAGALREFSDDVAGAGRQMLLLIEDIVLWARLRTGALPAAEARSVRALVLPVVTLHRPLAERQGIELTVEVPEGLFAWTDLVLAQTMVRNLVGNAVKFARSRVEVTARAEGAAVRITVRDDGPGLPAAVRAWFGGEAPAAGSADGGGGMGLRLSREIGAMLGARIETAERAGGGTELSVVLPALGNGEVDT